MAFIVPYGQLSKACSMTAYLNSKLGMPFPDSFTIILSPAILRRLHGALEVSPACPRANRAISAASSNTGSSRGALVVGEAPSAAGAIANAIVDPLLEAGFGSRGGGNLGGAQGEGDRD